MQNEDMKSVLRLDRLSFEEIQYTRNVDVEITQVNYEMNFTKQIVSSTDETNYRVALIANIWSTGKDNTKLKITLVGYFHCESEDKELKKKLVENNAIAILFPYLRSQISLVTTQPDLPSIILPPMNSVNMFEEKKEE